MKLQFFRSIIFSVTVLTIVVSCNKTTDVLPQYMRSGNSITLANNGNLIIAGYNSTSSKGYQATLISATASGGDTNWQRNYGDAYADAFYSVINSHENGLVATGFSNRTSIGSPSMYVVITDANGILLNSAKYGGSAISQGFSVASEADSSYLVAGYIQQTSTSDRDIYLVKINKTGSVIWEKSFGANSTNPYDTVQDAAYSVIAAPNGGFFVSGTMNGSSSGIGRIFLMKVSSSGDSLWTRTYNKYGIAYSLALTHDAAGLADGNVALGGTLLNGTNEDIFINKMDSAGKMLWSDFKNYGGSGYEYGSVLVETADHGFAITGITDSRGAGSQDVFLVITNSTGDISGDGHTYGGSGVDQGFGLIQLPEGDFCLTGLSNSGGSFIFLNRVLNTGGQATGWPTPRYIE